MSMPDVLSLPLGGGTIVHVDEENRIERIGPDSVGYQLEKKALAFGGQVITSTDIALAAGLTSGVEIDLSMTTFCEPKAILFRSVIRVSHYRNRLLIQLSITSNEPLVLLWIE